MSIKTRPSAVTTIERPTAKRARKERTLSSGSHNDGEQDQASMLAALQAHSRMMLGLSDDQPESSAMAQRRQSGSISSGEDDEEDNSEEEDEEDEEDFHSDDGWGAEDGMVSDSEDEFINTSKAVPEVIFDQSSSGQTRMISMSEKRAFLHGNSAKLMGLKPQNLTQAKPKSSITEDQDEANNVSLDRTLHSLLVNSLLPSHNSANSLRPVEKRNLLHSRLQQLSELPSPSSSRSSSPATLLPNKQNHSAKIKTGIAQKAQKRELKSKEESRMAGSYHSSLGGLSDLGKGRGGIMGKSDLRRKEKEERMGLGEVKRKKGMDGKDLRRERGLGNGIGKFEGGMLKLSKGEIARVEGRERGFSGGGGSRGGGRGGKGGRGGRGGGGRGGSGKRKRQ